MGRGIDDAHMREGLREIAEKAFPPWIVFLGEEAKVVAQGQQPLEQRDGVLMAANQREAVRQPKRANKESSLTARQPVTAGSCRVAHDQAIDDQLSFNRLDRADDARILRWQKAELGDQQQRGIEIAAAVILDEAVAPVVVSLGDDLLVNAPAQLVPALSRSRIPILIDRFDGTVEGDPRHDLGKGKVLGLAAAFPEPLIGLVPDLLEKVEQFGL